MDGLNVMTDKRSTTTAWSFTETALSTAENSNILKIIKAKVSTEKYIYFQLVFMVMVELYGGALALAWWSSSMVELHMMPG